MKRFVVPLFFLMLASATSHACTACFGQSDSNMAKGMNMGILVLLMIITSVLFGVASFFVYLIKRSSRLEQMQTAHGLNPSFSEHSTNA